MPSSAAARTASSKSAAAWAKPRRSSPPQHPQNDYLGIEVHTPGVGSLLKEIATRELSNLRVIQHDAVEVVRDMIPPGSLSGIHIFFPDPWPKKRQQKRRLIQPGFVALLATRLTPTGYLHCATDWEDYANQMLEVLSAEPLCRTWPRLRTPRPPYRPQTKFESRGLRLGHGVWDLVFRRNGPERLMAAVSFAHALTILRHGPRTFSTYFTATALLVLALTQTLRLRSAFGLPAGGGAFDSFQPEQTAYIAIYAFAILTTTIGMVLMATDRLRGELEHLATHDSLTGALNRRALIEAAELELARCRRNHGIMALLMIDLDHFKAINDTHGHPVGDRVLVDFVARVKNLLRQPDRFGRFGGEEFVALLPETPLNEARLVAERLRAMIEANTADLPRCTVSIGVSVSRLDDAGLDNIITRADAALYQAKRAGRNRVESVTALAQ
jgi:tRNA (guanine-N(7)-)-methyltransferase